MHNSKYAFYELRSVIIIYCRPICVLNKLLLQLQFSMCMTKIFTSTIIGLFLGIPTDYSLQCLVSNSFIFSAERVCAKIGFLSPLEDLFLKTVTEMCFKVFLALTFSLFGDPMSIFLIKTMCASMESVL